MVSTVSAADASVDHDYSHLLENIQDPTLKDVIQSSVDQITLVAAQDGYGGLFYSTVIISAIVVLLAIILKPIRKKAMH